MIKLQVIGNLGRDCTVNNVNGRTVINFSVAHTERYRDSTTGEMKPRTTWVECAYWTDKTAIAPYLKKGSLVYAEGNPDTRTYQTQDGNNKTSLTLRIQNVQLLGSRNNAENAGDGNSTGNNDASMNTQTHSSSTDEGADDLPF
ncbi:MAG TPA: single-stranded DNA-binding protein [Arachidicoccus soli]|uniref:Single-stranded DNA-binding protein n=1 Tax=Arachidicoccus soli TaxID=2341117 RepID=A0A386HRB0_9BACT|nr:single-stranded DNA-binding protein [Arachidicoccus soli]AYD48385.1 single-stranded DNA-binding protein [Arachidicoccus soli]HEU0227388.1 single-stranded DNA-binding protein [Arachidicoccus soli]